MFGNFSLRTSYLLLIGLTALSSALSWVCKDEWISAYSSNIAAGILGSLIIILLVDRIMERNREKERLRVVRSALKRLRSPISNHMSLLRDIYKATTQNKPTILPSTFEDIFTDDFYKEITFLDFAKDAPVALEWDWFTLLGLMTKSFKEKLEQVIDTYATSLDVELIDMLENTINSNFFVFMPQIILTPQVDRRHKVKRAHYAMFAGMEQIVKEHVSHMLKLVEYYNSHGDSPIRLFQGPLRDNHEPKWGSGRI